MEGRVGAIVLLCLLAGPALGGCLSPFQAHVPQDVLDRLAQRIEWKVMVGDVERQGSARVQETRYTHDGPPQQTPFPGVLQVFSVREVSRTPTDDILERMRSLVDEAVEEHGIRIDRSKDEEGERRLANGVPTKWFYREGTTERQGTLFSSSSTVRVVGEVGHDGKSSTTFVVVGLAQVARGESVGVPIIGGSSTRDPTTWNQIAGDPQGSVPGAVHRDGLVHNLRTHG